MARPRSWLSLAGAARYLNKSRDSVLALIRARELAATDARQPGAAQPRYRIERADLDRWRESRAVVPVEPPPEPVRSMPRMTGLYARRRAARAARGKVLA